MAAKIDPLAKAAYHAYWAGHPPKYVKPFAKLTVVGRRKWSEVVKAVVEEMTRQMGKAPE
jgi:hypothetical protein